MKKFRLLVCMLSLMSLAVLTACDDDDDDNGSRNPGTNPPTALSGQTMTVAVTASTGDQFVPAGESYTLQFGDGTYTFTSATDTFEGTYTYDRPVGSSTATLIFDPGQEFQVDSTLTFTSETEGTIQSSNAAGDTETGNFTLTGP